MARYNPDWNKMYEYGIYDAKLTAKALGWTQAVDEWTSEQPVQILDRWEQEAKDRKEKEKALTAKNTQIAQIQAEISKLQKKLEVVQHGRMGKEPSNGSVFKIEKRFEAGGKGYAYAAIKADGKWYLTGTGFAGSKTYDWEGLKNFIGQYSRVWVMTAREELVDA